MDMQDILYAATHSYPREFIDGKVQGEIVCTGASI